ncbi:hypothetical protein [Candidatus Palauibacter sp.]|uniref:hypothetical protein n=1 Tax=Candidatus Palauibacter sp. TaxID=3101350 RepID=UPI003AF2E681
MEGSTATITAIAAGDAVITISASDGSASVSQGFTVTVQAEPVNNPPVAVGTIPGSSLEIGGTSTIDAAGYFSDADGDELTYTGSSSNEGVATVAMEGASATITAIAAGDAVITISASDGSASVSQGFRVEVNAGPKEATVVITRLLDADRQQISDPSGISGTIYVVLDVESNDETWTDIGLTLGGETVTPMCRGSASADVAVGPGLAAAGQAEIECQLTTNAVVGECVGMQLDPKYANGEYQLGAFLTTDADERREAIAGQPIALNNHGFVKIAHVPGSQSEVGTHTEGLTFYGGPSVEGNVNSFHACPVAYDGTEVGTMQLGTVVTDTERPTPNPIAEAARATFREGGSGSYYPIKEAPFTWSISTASSRNANGGVENVPGETEHWIINDGTITDPNGRDVSATFRAGGEEAMLGPLHFDFKAPAIAENSEVVIAAANAASGDWVSTDAVYYRDGAGGSARRFRITEMTDMGVGHVYGTTSAIAVGDHSAGRNADVSPNTAFTPLGGLENVTHHQSVARGRSCRGWRSGWRRSRHLRGRGPVSGGPAGECRSAWWRQDPYGLDLRRGPHGARDQPRAALRSAGAEDQRAVLRGRRSTARDRRRRQSADGAQSMRMPATRIPLGHQVITGPPTPRPATVGGSVDGRYRSDGERPLSRVKSTHVVYVRTPDMPATPRRRPSRSRATRRIRFSRSPRCRTISAASRRSR